MTATLDQFGTKDDLDFSKNETQRAAFSCTARFQLYNGGFGSGKTSVWCRKALALSQLIPNNFGAVLRQTYPDLRDTTRKAFLSLVQPDEVRYWKESENALTLKPSNSVVIFRYFENGITKLGSDLGWFFVDQAEEAEEDIFTSLMGRLRRNVPVRYGLLAMNPNGHAWQYKRFVKDNKATANPPCICGKHNQSDFAYFESSSYDNKANLPDNYIEDMVKNYPQEWVERFVLGKWNQMSGLIYHEFDEDQHMCDPFDIPSSWVKFRGNDWGIDAPSTCAFWAVKPGPVPTFYKFDEYEDRQKTAEEHADAILAQSKQYGTFRASIMDQSAFNKGSDLKSVADKYKAKGYQCLPATKDQMASILTVKQLLSTNRVFYFRGKTERTIEEMKAWKWAAKQQGKEIPARGNDHHLDSDRYALHWAWKKLFLSGGMDEKEKSRANGRYEAYGKLSKISQATKCDPVTGLPA